MKLPFKDPKGLKVFLLGPMQMIFSALCFSFMSYFAKLATYTIPSQEVTFFRLALGTLAAMAVVRAQKGRLVTENYKLLVVRGFFGGIAVLLFFMSLGMGTVTNSVVLQNTYPIFATLIAALYLKEKVTLQQVGFLVLTFTGILLLTRPDLGTLKPGDIFALLSGLTGGFAIAAVRQLRAKSESTWTIFFYFCSFGAVLALLLSISVWKWPGGYEYLLILLTSVLGLMGQVCMTAAYKYCTTTIGSILSMSTCIFSFGVGLLLLGEKAGIMDIGGILLVVAGSTAVVVMDSLKGGKVSAMEIPKEI